MTEKTLNPVGTLIEALCGRGWDSPAVVDLEVARSCLKEHDALLAADLFGAITAGRTEAVRALLADDPEAVTRPGGPRSWPPILYAAFSHADQLTDDHSDITGTLDLLLEAGADPNTAYFSDQCDNGFSALYATIAVSKDRARTHSLLAAGARPSDGNATYSAVETFDLALVKALCDAGAERDDLSYIVKHAMDMGWVACVTLLLDYGADPNAVHPAANETSLHWAVKRGWGPEHIQMLLDHGADPNARTTNGRAAFLGILGHTPHDYALRLGHLKAAQAMEAAGAVPSPTTPELAFVFAVARGDADAAQALLSDNDGLFERLPEEDRQLLAHWAQHNQHAGVNLACKLGFSLESTAWMDLTAVHWAALRGNPAMLTTLLDAGAPIVDLGGYFGTPMQTAENCQWYAGGPEVDYEAVIAVLGAREH